MSKGYTISKVESDLGQKKIGITGKTITIPNDPDIGNKTWGKIDFLCNFHGYNWTFAH